MALQRPVISTYVAGIPELIIPGQHGWLVPAGDVDALVGALLEQLKDARVSSKQDLLFRRIVLRDGTASSIRPSFLMPSMTARTEDVEGPLFLRQFGVPTPKGGAVATPVVV